jgi:hypothetical protein
VAEVLRLDERVGAVSHVFWSLAVLAGFIAGAQTFAYFNPPMPATIIVPLKPAGLQVNCREVKWICHQRIKSGKTKQLGTNSN